MAIQEHLDILAEGVDAWNWWRNDNPSIFPDLSDAMLSGKDLHNADLHNAVLHGTCLRSTNLSGADLAGATLCRANLHSADLDGANLTRTRLSGADLNNASLFGANLSGADLIGADLTRADLTRANLSAVNLFGANLSGADLKGARFGSAFLRATIFGDVDLSGVVGLAAVTHGSPSTIGIDTIYRSGGKIPEIFLRGAGVPESFIAFLKSLTGAALDFYSVFISYSTIDQEFADSLFADLQGKGVRCWLAPHDIQGGQKIHEQIDEAIKVYDKLLLILSDASMNSEWVSAEISKAHKREREDSRRMLFPISLVPFSAIEAWECFDADAKKDSAREIREYFIPDFSNWKDHDSYTKAFERLVRDLKAGPGGNSVQPKDDTTAKA